MTSSTSSATLLKPAYSIDPLTEEELPKLSDISRETFYDTFIAITAPDDMKTFLDEAYNVDELRKEFLNPDSRFYFVHVEGAVAGYLKLNVGAAQTEQMGDNTLEVQRLYLRTAYKHRGLGTALMAMAEKIARQEKRSAMWLGVWEHNVPAQGLYKKSGFEFCGDHVFQVGDDPQRDLLMMKQLH